MTKLYRAVLLTGLALALAGCSDKEVADSKNKEPIEQTNKSSEKEVKGVNEGVLKEDFTLEFSTLIPPPQYAITEEEYEKYNRILEYLNSNPDKSEDELFKDLEQEFGDTSANLKSFVNANMQNAIDYDMGRAINEETLAKSDVIETVKQFFIENVENNKELKVEVQESDIELTNLKAVATSNFTYEDKDYEYILKVEYTEDLQTAKVFQLKVNGVDIDLE